MVAIILVKVDCWFLFSDKLKRKQPEKLRSKEGGVVETFGGAPSFPAVVASGGGEGSALASTKEAPFSSAADSDSFATTASSSEGEEAKRKFKENTDAIVNRIARDPRLWKNSEKEVSLDHFWIVFWII